MSNAFFHNKQVTFAKVFSLLHFSSCLPTHFVTFQRDKFKLFSMSNNTSKRQSMDPLEDNDEEKGQSENQTEILRNPPELDGVPDLSQLIHLDMPNVLHNLKHRYKNMPTKFCYTQLSSILLAINPYETLPIYGQDVIDQFRAAAAKGRMITDRPHPYGVSARSYMRMVQRKCNQSVIVCGESGAGKVLHIPNNTFLL